METKKMLIAGEWRSGADIIEVRNPYSGEKIADVYSADASELNTAVNFAEKAAAEMREISRFDLAQGLRKMSEAILKRKEDLARCIAEESAKPITAARVEAERAVATFAWAAGEAERFAGEIVPINVQSTSNSPGNGPTAWTVRVPRGIIYGISPFNFPLNLVAHKVAPALASRNAIIIKPSQRTPLTALMLGEIFLESSLPTGALQIVPMNTDHMDAVFADERLKMISFTGSDVIGWDLKAKAGKKAVALELGGNAAVIVASDADVEKSVKKTAAAAFGYAGQVCISVQRVYVHESLFDDWTTKLVHAAKALVIGDPLDEKTQLSVMIDEKAAQKAEKWIGEAKDNGATIICGGTRSGAMLDATVITDTTPEMRVVTEEIFAPVVVVEKFSDLDEAINLVNHSKFGLQAGIFTKDLHSATQAAEKIEAGGVIINDTPSFRVDNMPYGGVKDSGFGREGIRYAMEEMSEVKLVVLNY